MDIDPDRILRSPFVTGALGAVVTALKFTPAGTVWYERVINVLCGSLLAGFLTPAFVEFVGLTSPEMSFAAGFMFGLVGLSLAAALLKAIKDTAWAQIISSWLRRNNGWQSSDGSEQ